MYHAAGHSQLLALVAMACVPSTNTAGMQGDVNRGAVTDAAPAASAATPADLQQAADLKVRPETCLFYFNERGEEQLVQRCLAHMRCQACITDQD